MSRSSPCLPAFVCSVNSGAEELQDPAVLADILLLHGALLAQGGGGADA